MAKNISTNPCDTDRSKTKTVQNLQLRRGKLFNLPQPLKSGELGWAMDVKKLYIGTSCDYSPSGVQVKNGEFSYAQSLIDNSFIIVSLSQSYTPIEWEDFWKNLESNFPDITKNFQTYDGDITILIGLPGGFTDVSSLISYIQNNGSYVTNAIVGPSYTVDTIEGTITSITYEISGMIAHLLNNIADKNIATNLLNVKIYTSSDGVELLENKGEPNGYAPLDSNGQVPASFLPSSSIGGLNYWEEFLFTSSPNDTKNTIQWTTSDGTTNVNVALTPKGNGAIQAQVADNGVSGGNIRGDHAVDFQMSRSAAFQVAEGNYSFIGGGRRNRVESMDSGVVNGIDNRVNGSWSFIGGGSSNSVSATLSTIVGGQQNELNGSSSFIGGGSQHISRDDYSFIGGGQNNQNETGSSYSFIGGGQNNISSDSYSSVLGGFNNIILGPDSGYSTTLGGRDNSVLFGACSIILGGHSNNINHSDYSLAAGRRSKVLSDHNGSFILSDSQNSDHESTQENEMRLRFQNGVYINGNEVYHEGNLPSSGSGGDLEHWSESRYIDPSTSTDAVIFEPLESNAVRVDVVVQPRESGSFSLNSPDGSATNGGLRGMHAVDLQGVRSSNSQVAAGFASGLFVGINNTIAQNAEDSVILGGTTNTIGVGGSFMFGSLIGSSNQSTISSGNFTTVLSTETANVDGQYSVAIGRQAQPKHAGSLVFTDSQTTGMVESTQENEMRLRFENGVYINGNEVYHEGNLDLTGLDALENLNEFLYTNSPNHLINVVSLEVDTENTTSDVDLAVVPRGTGAFMLDVPDNGSSGGNKRGTNAVDLQINRIASGNVASGNYSSIIGGIANQTMGDYGVALGGLLNRASGDHSISGGEASEAGGDHSLSIGTAAKALHGGSFVMSDYQTEIVQGPEGPEEQLLAHESTQENEMRLRFENGVFINGNEVFHQGNLTISNRPAQLAIQLDSDIELVYDGAFAYRLFAVSPTDRTAFESNAFTTPNDGIHVYGDAIEPFADQMFHVTLEVYEKTGNACYLAIMKNGDTSSDIVGGRSRTFSGHSEMQVLSFSTIVSLSNLDDIRPALVPTTMSNNELAAYTRMTIVPVTGTREYTTGGAMIGS